jgi:GTP-binding protein HflX
LPNHQKLLVTDTVGFIRRLPHGLVDAFKATLEEVVVADFLIHVIDVTNPNFEKHHATTLAVLGELGAAQKKILTVFNKVDSADDAMRTHALHLAPDGFFISAKTGAGVDALLQRCSELIAHEFGVTELLVPHSRYDVIAKLHAVGHVQNEEQRDDGVLIHGRFPPAQAALFTPFLVNKAAPATAVQ